MHIGFSCSKPVLESHSDSQLLLGVIGLERPCITWLVLSTLIAFVASLKNLDFQPLHIACHFLSLSLLLALGTCSPARNHSFLLLSFLKTLGNEDLVL